MVCRRFFLWRYPAIGGKMLLMNIITLLALSTVFPTVALSAFIAVSGRERKSSEVLLGVLFLIIALLTVSAVILSNWAYMRYFPVAHLCNLSIMLIGPVFYLYVKSSAQKVFRFKAAYWLLFLPFVLGLAWFSYRTVRYDLFYGKHTRQLTYKIIESVQDLIYFALSVVVLARNGVSPRRLMTDFRDWRVTWIRFLFISLIIISCNKFYTSIICDYFNNARLYLTSLSLYFLIVSAFVSLALFVFFNRDTFFSREAAKYRDSPLTEVEKKRLFAALLDCMQRDRPYLDPDLTLARLAERTRIPVKSLSQIVNELSGFNFNDFVNDYRLREACAMLKDSSMDSTVTDILYNSGFNSKSAFNEVFKRKLGKTPTAYRAEQRI